MASTIFFEITKLSVKQSKTEKMPVHPEKWKSELDRIYLQTSNRWNIQGE